LLDGSIVISTPYGEANVITKDVLLNHGNSTTNVIENFLQEYHNFTNQDQPNTNPNAQEQTVGELKLTGAKLAHETFPHKEIARPKHDS
jgi:hypothetical protein